MFDMYDLVTQSPSATLFCLIVGAVFILIEATPMLPTFGLAGIVGLVVGWLGVAGLADQGLTWWPLVLAALGAITFEVLILVRKKAVVPFGLASLAVAGGLIGVAVQWSDAGAIAIAVAAALAVPAVAWWLIGAVQRLMNAQAQTGVAALIGRTVQVEAWDGTTGAVALDGARWNARAAAGEVIVAGAEATVVSVDGLCLTISINK